MVIGASEGALAVVVAACRVDVDTLVFIADMGEFIEPGPCARYMLDISRVNRARLGQWAQRGKMWMRLGASFGSFGWARGQGRATSGLVKR